MQRCLVAMAFCIFLITGCVSAVPTPPPPPVGSCSLALPAAASDTDAIRALLTAEGELVVEQKIDALMQLWDDGAKIVNAKNTPDTTADDQAWFDKDAIRHRYVRTVFPGAPAQADPKDLEIQLFDNQAIITATTQIGDEISPAGDRWVLVRQHDCWLIERLTYNLEPQ
ncbi:MAG: hypothetical protein KF832_15800 [Caldilineaceae bacterium]|nr:hypothetical protein [Caldilineaceae bacterium]